MGESLASSIPVSTRTFSELITSPHRINCSQSLRQLLINGLLTWLAAYPLLVAASIYDYLEPDRSVYLKQISERDVISVLSDTHPALRFYQKSPSSDLYAVTIPFNIKQTPSECVYKTVRVSIRPDKAKRRSDGGFSIYDTYDEEVKAISAIPLSIDRAVEKSTSTRAAAEFAKAAGKFSFGYTVDERYVRFYRTVTTNIGRTIDWTFKPFKDEPILPGAYFVVGMLEVPKRRADKVLTVYVSVDIVKKGLLFESNECCLCGAFPTITPIR